MSLEINHKETGRRHKKTTNNEERFLVKASPISIINFSFSISFHDDFKLATEPSFASMFRSSR